MNRIVSPLDNPASTACNVFLVGSLLLSASNSIVMSEKYQIDKSQPVPIKQVIRSSIDGLNLDEIQSYWPPNWQHEAISVMNNFVDGIIKHSHLPDPEAASILEENLWDLA